MPAYSAAYVAAVPANGNYPAGGYSALLLTGFLLMVAVLAWYASGRAPAWLSRFDALSSSYMLLNVPGRGGGLKTAARTTKFGGALSLAALVAAVAMVAEVLAEYSTGSFALVTAVTAPAVGNDVFIGAQAALSVSLTAQRLPGPSFTQYGCQLTDWAPSLALRVAPTLAAASPSGYGANVSDADVPGGALVCRYTLTAPALTLLAGPYSTGASVAPTLRVAVGPGLQITGWSATLADGSPDGSYTAASSTTSIPLDVTSGRLHTVAMTLTPATYTDVSYVLSGIGSAGTTTAGYRAAVTAYTLGNNTAQWARQDALLLSFGLSTWRVDTTRAPRFTGLQLLGILFGLGVGSLLLFKFAHELLEAACDCPSLSAEEGRRCGCCRRGYVSGAGVGGAHHHAHHATTGYPKSAAGFGSVPPVHVGWGAGGPPDSLAAAAARSAVLSQPMVAYQPQDGSGGSGSLLSPLAALFGGGGGGGGPVLSAAPSGRGPLQRGASMRPSSQSFRGVSPLHLQAQQQQLGMGTGGGASRNAFATTSVGTGGGGVGGGGGHTSGSDRSVGSSSRRLAVSPGGGGGGGAGPARPTHHASISSSGGDSVASARGDEVGIVTGGGGVSGGASATPQQMMTAASRQRSMRLIQPVTPDVGGGGGSDDAVAAGGGDGGGGVRATLAAFRSPGLSRAVTVGGSPGSAVGSASGRQPRSAVAELVPRHDPGAYSAGSDGGRAPVMLGQARSPTFSFYGKKSMATLAAGGSSVPASAASRGSSRALDISGVS
jgi:hypothetical protein